MNMMKQGKWLKQTTRLNLINSFRFLLHIYMYIRLLLLMFDEIADKRVTGNELNECLHLPLYNIILCFC